MWRSRSLAQILLFCTCSLSIVPRLPGQVPDAWQPIPKDDLALKDNPANPGSSAMILERQVYTDDEKRGSDGMGAHQGFHGSGQSLRRSGPRDSEEVTLCNLSTANRRWPGQSIPPQY